MRSSKRVFPYFASLFILSLITFPFSVSAAVPPVVTTNPTDVTAKVGDTATFTVAASGDSLSYRWYRDSAGVLTATSTGTAATYKRYIQTFSDNGRKYCCVVSNRSGKDTSTSATLTVPQPPTIVTNPLTDSVQLGETAVFSVSATGLNPPLAYQWQKRNVQQTFDNVTGAITDTLKVGPVVVADNAAAYRCAVTDGNGTTNSSVASIRITNLPTPPTIVTQPKNDSLKLGETAVFSVSATSGSTPLTFQWQRRGTSGMQFTTIVGATDSIYSLAAVVDSNNGMTVRCAVTNPGGTTNSATASIVITNLPPPVITADPVDVTGAKIGDTASFKISFTGAVTAFQWQRDSGNGVFANVQFGAIKSDSIYKKIVAAADAFTRSYRCIIRNTSGGSDTSLGAKLIIKTPLTITLNPINDTVKVGDTASFTVAATSSYPPIIGYQWMRSRSGGGGGQWTAIAGATGTVLSIPGVVDSLANYSYRCAVTDSAGTVNSGSAIIIISATIAPKILTQPTNVAVAQNDSAKFITSVQGDKLNFRWYRDSAGVVTIVTGGGGGGGGNYTKRDSILAIRRAGANLTSSKFCLVIYNSLGRDSSTWASLTVTVGIINQINSSTPVRFSVSDAIVRTHRPVMFTFNTVAGAQASLTIYSVIGKIIYSDKWVQSGINSRLLENRYVWNQSSNSGQAASSGAYIAVLKVKGSVMNKVEKTRFEIVK